jgi:hypothetical protein
MGTQQLEFTSDELLMTHDVAERLVANGVACHGGFDDDGTYISPRTLHRGPAIEAWEAQRLEQFGTAKLDAPVEQWPEPFPNVEQTKLLLRHGVRDQVISILTRVGTVEGFGSMLRHLPLPDLHGTFEEDIRGTATEHIPRGLFEAHARDEAGFEDEAGHDRMWFAARDIAFEHPVTTDQTAIMLERMGISGPGDAPPDLDAMRRAALAARVLPDAVPFELESMLARMIGLLFIEISAFHTFRWAEEVLSDPELTAGDGEAARIVSYIRADETPHVGYLEVALSEMRDRTWIGTDGTRFDGAEMMPIVWDTALEQSMVARRSELLQLTMREIESALGTSGLATSARDDLLEEMFSLGTVDRLSDGRLVDRAA